MGIFPKKEEFVSKIPQKYQNLTYQSMTLDLVSKISSEFPELKPPKFIDSELQKGNMTEEKANQLKIRSMVNGIKSYVSNEKRKFDAEQTKKKNILPDKIKRKMIKVYESGSNGTISKDEVNYLIDALK